MYPFEENDKGWDYDTCYRRNVISFEKNNLMSPWFKFLIL